MSDSIVYRITVDPSGTISGTQQVENALDGVDNAAKSTEKSFGGIGARAVAIGAVAVAAFSRISGAIRQSITEAVNLARRQEEAEARVESLVRTTGMAAGFTARELRNMASEMQAMTRFGDESILEAQAKLLTFRSVAEDNFQGALMAAMDLAEAGFGSLEQNITQLGRALEDPIQGLSALRRSGVSFTEAQQDQIKALVESNQLYEAQALILGAVRDQVGGTAQAMAQTASGAVDQLNNAVGDLKENLGAIILEGFAPFARTLLQVVDAVNSYLSTPFSRELQEEQVQVNRLVSQIRDQNTSNEDRVRLLRELEQIQPDLVASLRDETLSNDELAVALREVNAQYANRIILQTQQEEIQAAAERVGRALNQQATAEIRLRENVIRLAQQQGIALDEFVNKPLDEQVSIVQRAVNASNVYVQNQTIMGQGARALQQDLLRYRSAIFEVRSAEEDAAELTQRHAEIRDILGLSFEESSRAAERASQVIIQAIQAEADAVEEFIDDYEINLDEISRMFERAEQEQLQQQALFAQRRQEIAMQQLDQAKDIRRKDVEDFRNAEQQKQQAFERSQQIFAASMGRAIAQQIEYADTFRDAVRQILKALLSEIIALSIRNAVAAGAMNPLAAAVFGPVAAATARRAFESLVPRFASGGWPGQRQHGFVQGAGTGTSDSVPALISRGEHVMNAASAGQMADTLNIANASPAAARTINEIVHRSISGGSVETARQGEMVVRVTGRIDGENITLANERFQEGRQRSDLEVF